MSEIENLSSDGLRGKTDHSLEEERGKTDEYLDQKTKKVSREAEESIRLNRLSADEVKEASRAAVDLEKEEHRGEGALSKDSKLEDKNLKLERETSDLAQKTERENEDKFRARERFQKRLIAEALLAGERKETDENLLDERSGTDKETKALLENEKSSHELTKTALVTRDQFVAIVSHDLKNPLGSISLSAALLREDLSEGGLETVDSLKYLEIIERNAAGMDRMISDLLDVQRMESGKMILNLESIDVSEILIECKELFAPIVMEKGLSLVVKFPENKIISVLDHDRILQILSNLIGNAIKFSPKGGIIELATKKIKSCVEVSVTDDGPGISKPKRETIFERFSQLQNPDRKGLGLGLFISKWIIEAHHGRIWASDVPSEKSAFIFSIPAN
jgi:signal transduction histidine kinase